MTYTDGRSPSEFTASNYTGLHNDCSIYGIEGTDGGADGDSTTTDGSRDLSSI